MSRNGAGSAEAGRTVVSVGAGGKVAVIEEGRVQQDGGRARTGIRYNQALVANAANLVGTAVNRKIRVNNRDFNEQREHSDGMVDQVFTALADAATMPVARNAILQLAEASRVARRVTESALVVQPDRRRLKAAGREHERRKRLAAG